MKNSLSQWEKILQSGSREDLHRALKAFKKLVKPKRQAYPQDFIARFEARLLELDQLSDGDKDTVDEDERNSDEGPRKKPRLNQDQPSGASNQSQAPSEGQQDEQVDNPHEHSDTEAEWLDPALKIPGPNQVQQLLQVVPEASHSGPPINDLPARFESPDSSSPPRTEPRGSTRSAPARAPADQIIALTRLLPYAKLHPWEQQARKVAEIRKVHRRKYKCSADDMDEFAAYLKDSESLEATEDYQEVLLLIQLSNSFDITAKAVCKRFGLVAEIAWVSPDAMELPLYDAIECWLERHMKIVVSIGEQDGTAPPLMFIDYTENPPKKVALTRTICLEARQNLDMHPSTIMAGTTVALHVLENSAGKSKCLTCHNSSRGQSAPKKGDKFKGEGFGFLDCGCPQSTSLLELWMAKVVANQHQEHTRISDKPNAKAKKHSSDYALNPAILQVIEVAIQELTGLKSDPSEKVFTLFQPRPDRIRASISYLLDQMDTISGMSDDVDVGEHEALQTCVKAWDQYLTAHMTS